VSAPQVRAADNAERERANKIEQEEFAFKVGDRSILDAVIKTFDNLQI